MSYDKTTTLHHIVITMNYGDSNIIMLQHMTCISPCTSTIASYDRVRSLGGVRSLGRHGSPQAGGDEGRGAPGAEHLRGSRGAGVGPSGVEPDTRRAATVVDETAPNIGCHVRSTPSGLTLVPLLRTSF